MRESDLQQFTREPEPSLDDLSVEEERRLFYEAREMEGEVAELARVRLSELSWPIIAKVAQRYRPSLGEAAYEDLLQDQILKVLDVLIDRHDLDEGRFAAYVATHTKYDGLTALSRAKREIPTLDDEGEMGNAKDKIADTQPGVEAQVIEEQDPSLIDADPLLSVLPEEEREVLELLIFDNADLTRQDVAERLGVSVATVGYRKSRALERLLDSGELSSLLSSLSERGEYESLTAEGLGRAIIERRQIRIDRAREKFMAEREERLEAAAHESYRRARSREEAARERADERAKEISERRRRYQEEQNRIEAEIEERNAALDARRKIILERLAEERRDRLVDLDEYLAPSEIRILAYLHLPAKEAARLLGIKYGNMSTRSHSAKQKLGVETREELALWALEHGVVYDVAKPPEMETFTLRERLVASRLWRRNPDIAKDLDITDKQVRSDVMSLLKKTGANNRTELALIAQIYGFEPFPEELEDDTPEALKPFTDFQRRVLSRLHLPGDIIAGELGISRYGVAHAVDYAKRKTGTSNRTALALKLMEDGYQFDIHEPDRPLQELLTDQELAIAKSLYKPYEEIAQDQGLDFLRVNNLVDYMKRKTGARTRVELALIAHMFDTGQSKSIYHNIRPREDRFFEALNIEPIDMEEVRELLSHATPKQAEYIEAYYFSEKPVSWRVIGERFFVTRANAMQAANRGLARIRQKLEEREKVS